MMEYMRRRQGKGGAEGKGKRSVLVENYHTLMKHYGSKLLVQINIKERVASTFSDKVVDVVRHVESHGILE